MTSCLPSLSSIFFIFFRSFFLYLFLLFSSSFFHSFISSIQPSFHSFFSLPLIHAFTDRSTLLFYLLPLDSLRVGVTANELAHHGSNTNRNTKEIPHTPLCITKVSTRCASGNTSQERGEKRSLVLDLKEKGKMLT